MDKDFHHDDPLNWKWGVFYFNPKDSRSIVPKRMKTFGWTVNFAHPKVWLGLALMVLILVAAEEFTKR